MSDQAGRVSIIIPTYNRAHLIGQSIESVLNQTYPNVELIVVDDGSTDDTRSVVEQYGSSVKYIFQDNAGPSVARNNGVSASNAEFIGFLDSDDIYLPTKIEKQVEYLDNHPEIDVVLCHWSLLHEDRVTIAETFSEVPADNIVKRILLTGIWGYFPPNVALLRRSAFLNAGGFIESLPAREEQAFWMHVALSGSRFATIEEVLCYMIATPKSRGKNIPNVARTMPLVLESVFSHPNLPEDVARLKSEIYARWYLDLGYGFLTLCDGLESPELDTAVSLIHKGVALNPSREAWRPIFVDVVSSNAVLSSDDEAEAKTYLNTLIEKLFPPPLTPRWVIRHITAQFHAAMAFRAFESRRTLPVWRHVLQAFIYQPGQLRNPGLSAILVKSILQRNQPN